jgi:hypothetical protein
MRPKPNFSSVCHRTSPQLARGCRNVVPQQVDSYLGYTGRGANPFGKAARDPKRSYDALSVHPNELDDESSITERYARPCLRLFA